LIAVVLNCVEYLPMVNTPKVRIGVQLLGVSSICGSEFIRDAVCQAPMTLNVMALRE